MRRSREETAETRRNIVKAAGIRFRQNGICETGLADLMESAGLTHGGFYRHFDSKDQLVSEASAGPVAAKIREKETSPSTARGRQALQTIVHYFSSPLPTKGPPPRAPHTRSRAHPRGLA